MGAKKVILSLAITVAAVMLFPIVSAQTLPVAPIHPVETICKKDWGTLPNEYAVVGETYHMACADGGMNAWEIKRLEDGDLVCMEPHKKFFQGQPHSQFSPLFYDVIDESYSNNCPIYKINNVEQQVNAAVLHLKEMTNPWPLSNPPPYNGWAVPQGYINVTLNENISRDIVVPGIEEIKCTSTAVPRGYVQIGTPFHYSPCSAAQNTYHGQYIRIPRAVEEEVLTTNISAHVLNFIAYAAYKIPYPGSGTVLTHDIKRASNDTENACFTGHLYIPIGYIVTGQSYTVACNKDGESSTDTRDNTMTIKKLKDPTEIMCKRFYSSGTKYTNIPNSYSVVREFISDDCWRNPSTPTATNAYELQRIY